MNLAQKALVRYWVIGLSIILALVFLYFFLGNPVQFRWIFLLAILIAVFVERHLRPARPADAPTPLQIVQNSRAWTLFFVLYAVSAVVLATVSISFHNLGSWMSHNPWLLGPLILVPLLIPLIQSEIYLYKALGNQ